MPRIIKNQIKSLYIIYGVLIILALAFLTNLIKAHNTSAENVEYNVNIAPALNITVTSDGIATNDIVLDLNPLNHTFDNKSINVNVATNNATGYQLFMSTSNSKTTLDRDNSDGNGIATIDTLPVLEEGYTKDTFIVNKWGYKVTSSDTMPSLITDNYYPFTLNKELSMNHSTTSGDNTTLDFAAKINWDQIAGSYSNTLVFTAVATYAAYDIKYYDGVDNTEESYIATQTNSYNTSSKVKLDPTYKDTADTTTITDPDTGNTITIPARNTYDFIKWCDQLPTADTNNYFPATTCSGNSYNTGDTITINPEDYNTNIKLYAYWDPTTFEEAYEKIAQSTGDASITTKVTGKTSTNQDITAYQMQKMSKDICAATTINEVTQLVDSRSGNYAYYVAKLKDDKCWMTQNLRLGTNITATTGTLRLYPSDSNIPDTTSYWDLTNKLSDGKFPYKTLNPDDRYDSDGDKATQYYDDNAYYCTPVSDNSYVGCYYNWFSATAGTGTSSVTPGTSGWKDVSSSICPKNWQLPTGGTSRSDSDFQVLYNNYPSAEQMLVDGTATFDNTTGKPAPGLLLSGRYSAGGADLIEQRGYYWSRSAWSKGVTSSLSFTSSTVYAQGHYVKYAGRSVRCLAYGS